MALASRVTLKSLTSLSLSVMVLSLTFPLCVSSRVAAVHLGGGITVCAILMTSYRPVPMSRTTNTRTSTVSWCLHLVHKAFAFGIVGMSGQIHVDFLQLLWVLADKLDTLICANMCCRVLQRVAARCDVTHCHAQMIGIYSKNVVLT